MGERAIVLICSSCAYDACMAAQAPAPPPIRNFLRHNDLFCTGGQPRLEHFAQLKADGVRAVMNLRTPGEHRAAEEEAAVKALGLRYFNIPVVFGHPTDEQATEFLRLTDDPANRPAFIHCTAAIRVGAFWMIRRVLRDGLTIEAAKKKPRPWACSTARTSTSSRATISPRPRPRSSRPRRP